MLEHDNAGLRNQGLDVFINVYVCQTYNINYNFIIIIYITILFLQRSHTAQKLRKMLQSKSKNLELEFTHIHQNSDIWFQILLQFNFVLTPIWFLSSLHYITKMVSIYFVCGTRIKVKMHLIFQLHDTDSPEQFSLDSILSILAFSFATLIEIFRLYLGFSGNLREVVKYS